ncbi:hypothetical protein T265_07877 [Opisthorchis viverrini]|uniref:Uncharacterized protein n=1 Tax=Opisthorchis viverrini TaxID=6198 RepID=A0A074ZBE3_OPIVI|nr:hypothetical protein T265_07877 [Opisthorchis viverrini]KER24448.1 hypothetical protein T265_07877 [Opisthorchis viverrini]
MQPRGSTKHGILPGCPSLDRGSREANVGFPPGSSEEKVPVKWDMCYLIYLIFKKGTRTLCENQCGVSLLAVASKLLLALSFEG